MMMFLERYCIIRWERRDYYGVEKLDRQDNLLSHPTLPFSSGLCYEDEDDGLFTIHGLSVILDVGEMVQKGSSKVEKYDT